MRRTWTITGVDDVPVSFEVEPRLNPNTRTAELSLRDADGYCVTIGGLPVA